MEIPHDQAPDNHGKAFIIGIVLNASYVVIELIYGFMAHSSALLADAGHNIGDVLGLAFSWGALVFAFKKPSPKYTYGLKRMSILAAILNGLILLVTIGIIAGDAIHKLRNIEKINENIVMWVAGMGIVVNGITAWLFVKGRKDDMNIKGAFLHMAGDAAVSLGILIAGLIIKFTGYYWVDPVMCFIIVAIVLYETWDLMKDSVNLALDAVPESIDLHKVMAYLESVKGVKKVYDLHIWAMSTTQTALSVHLLIPGHQGDDHLLGEITAQLDKRFKIVHPTIQIVHDSNSGRYDEDCLGQTAINA
jgi:cobalt-zinc-cadmium efflux system protein